MRLGEGPVATAVLAVISRAFGEDMRERLGVYILKTFRESTSELRHGHVEIPTYGLKLGSIYCGNRRCM